jgi:hypothetical protein
MENKTLLIDRNAFCDWYFDHSICKEFVHAHSIIQELKDEGTFTITLQDILNSAGYLPSNLVSNQQELVILDELDEVDMSYYDKIIFDN